MFRHVRVYEWIGMAVLALAAIVWAVRLEGRVNTLDDLREATAKSTAKTIEQIRDDLSYIRTRVDEALGQGR